MTEMTRSTRLNRSGLGESWVVEESNESDASYTPSDDEVNHGPDVREASRRPPQRSLPSSPASNRRTTRASPGPSEPEFIMPSIDEDAVSGPWTTSNSRNRGDTRARRRGSRSSTLSASRSSRATPQPESFSSKWRARSGHDELSERVADLILLIRDWVIDVLGGFLWTLKTPLKWLAVGYLIFGLFIFTGNFFLNSFYTALTPLCRLPGSSMLNLPFCQTGLPPEYKDVPNEAVEFDRLMVVQSKFDEILDQSAAGVSLPLDMKRGEASIRDLRQIVRFSHLQSKHELVLEFDGFIDTARMASYDLQKFNSHVGRGVDNVLATARWTKRVLDSIADRDASRGLVPSFITNTVLAPFTPMKFTEAALLDQYIQHTRIVEDEINRLIEEAQALLMVLQNLEDRLEVIHSIALRDDLHAQGSKDEVLSSLWTMLGGNRAKLGKYNSQLKLLRQVGEYRKIAWAHVTATIMRLQAMGAELEELRERVGSAELLRDRADIPLAVHIENIQLGVERLEAGRAQAKVRENEHLRRVLGQGPEEGLMLVEG